MNPDAEDTCGDGIDQDCDGEDAACAPPSSDRAAGCDASGSGAHVLGVAALALLRRRRRPSGQP